MTRPSFMSTLAALVAPLAFVAACGGADAPAAQTAKPAAATDDAHAVCVQSFTRQRECTDTYIPALVALRVEKDVPPGIAATDASEGRDALVARANAEWAEDSTDARIAESCTAMEAKMPADQLAPLMEQAQECNAAADCEAFVACVIPLVGQHMGH